MREQRALLEQPCRSGQVMNMLKQTSFTKPAFVDEPLRLCLQRHRNQYMLRHQKDGEEPAHRNGAQLGHSGPVLCWVCPLEGAVQNLLRQAGAASSEVQAAPAATGEPLAAVVRRRALLATCRCCPALPGPAFKLRLPQCVVRVRLPAPSSHFYGACRSWLIPVYTVRDAELLQSAGLDALVRALLFAACCGGVSRPLVVMGS